MNIHIHFLGRFDLQNNSCRCKWQTRSLPLPFTAHFYSSEECVHISAKYTATGIPVPMSSENPSL